MRRALALALATCIASCAAHPPDRTPPRSPARSRQEASEFLASRVVAWPEPGSPSALALTDPERGRVAVYDSALVALVMIRRGQRETAARLLTALAALQADDGALPFSFVLPRPDPKERYVRAGAVAWAGYAAVEYLDADAGGPAREVVLGLARRAAEYLMAHQVAKPGDPRDGLITGGFGAFRYVRAGGRVREIFVPGEILWTATEHNVDAYFFLRALARVTETPSYAAAADRIAAALSQRAWNPAAGQFAQGIGAGGPDFALALDCASWGSVFLSATRDARAETAYAVASGRYASRDQGAHGHRPYASGAVLPDPALQEEGRSLPATWDRLEVVWPEGSAGVALAALRVGRPERARAILDDLEALRDARGALPTATVAIPFTLDTGPSVGGTAWVELVRFELERPPDRPTLWAP